MRIGKKNTILYFISFTLLFFFCTKKGATPDISEITIGDTQFMQVNQYHKVIDQIYESTNYFDFDINNDGVNDYRLRNFNTQRPIWQSTWSQLISLNSESKIFGRLTNDTTFLVHSVIQSTQSIQISSNPPTFTTVVSTATLNYYSCNHADSGSAIFSIKRNCLRLLTLNSGNVLNRNGFFKNDTIQFSYYFSQSQPADMYAGELDCYTFDCEKFDFSKPFYVGVMISKNGFNKIGWIKLFIENGFKINLIETAIQK